MIRLLVLYFIVVEVEEEQIATGQLTLEELPHLHF